MRIKNLKNTCFGYANSGGSENANYWLLVSVTNHSGRSCITVTRPFGFGNPTLLVRIFAFCDVYLLGEYGLQSSERHGKESPYTLGVITRSTHRMASRLRPRQVHSRPPITPRHTPSCRQTTRGLAPFATSFTTFTARGVVREPLPETRRASRIRFTPLCYPSPYSSHPPPQRYQAIPQRWSARLPRLPR